MYITEEDILNIIAKDDFDAALAEGFTSMEALTRTACSTMRNYLYQRYRIGSEFNKAGEARNPYLVMIACDITLYLWFCIYDIGCSLCSYYIIVLQRFDEIFFTLVIFIKYRDNTVQEYL